jgi:ABC-type polysaccharide/polyol phosphate transport system ATPase subunit
MLRRVFLAGIDNRHWTLIKSLHENTKGSVKWDGNIAEPFNVNQGVRQGFIGEDPVVKPRWALF